MNLLTHITVLDFSRLLPGPLGTQMLRQMGAEVWRVEHPERSDMARSQPPFEDGKSIFFELLNSDKKTWRLDYTSPDSQRLLMEKIKSTDVVIEQFRPGVMAKWGLDYESLKAIKPDLVYISLSGYGQTGDMAMTPGHDLNYLAETGALSLNTDASGKPVIPGFQLADIGSGSYGLVQACLAGLLHRERTGEGSHWDVSMAAGLLPMMALSWSQHRGGIDPGSLKVLHGGLVNYNVYACADGQWIALAALEPKFWRAFCEWAGKPEWIRSNLMELSVHLFPKSELEDFFKACTRDEWLDRAEGHELCLSPVRSLSEARDFGVIQELPGGLFTFRSPINRIT